MFSTVLHLLLYSLTVAFLHYFFIMPVALGSNLNLTYGLKPQVSSIKIVTVYRWSIFQVESHYTTSTSRPLNKIIKALFGMLRTWMGDQIRIPRVLITSVFLPCLSKATLKTAQLPGLCAVVSSISELFVPYFTMSAFTYIYLQHRINKQPNASFEFFSILSTFDRLKQ